MRLRHQLTFVTFLRTLNLYLRRPAEAVRMERRAWGELQGLRNLKRLGYDKLYAKQPDYALEPDPADLWNIYRLIRERKPKLVYEFGAGCSTLMFAQALHDNRSGKLVSIDDSPYWRDLTKSYMPAHLCQFTEFLTCPVKTENGLVRYQGVPLGSPDFVYIDGPAYAPDSNITANAVDLEGGTPNYFVLFDGRGATRRWTKANLKGSYKETVNPVHHWSTLECIS